MTPQLTSKSTIKIMHLSDIHFCESGSALSPTHRHSLECMEQIERIFKSESPDLLIITGDLTNLGDSNSFDRVRQWITDKINVSAKYYGLQVDQQRCGLILVPGNHDAFNASGVGANLKRWQRSLDNYYTAFPEFPLGEKGVNYTFYKKGNLRLFICAVDSCYLGDPHTENLPNSLNLDRVAKGKISRKQSEEILHLYDKGIRGELPAGANPNGPRIARSDFLASFKLMAIHHYLFEPDDFKQQPLLHMRHRTTAFQNIAMADFDALICGHKHVADSKSIFYLDHFEQRGRIRHALNHVRRVLGIDSLPLQEDDEKGKSIKRYWRFALSALYLKYTNDLPLNDQSSEEIIKILRKSLSDKSALKKEVIDYIKGTRGGRSGSLFEKEELLNLHRLINQKFSRGEIQELMETSDTLKDLVAKLAKRPFVHVMAGSSAKASEAGGRRRSFNIYEVTADDTGQMHQFSVRRFGWSQTPEGEFRTIEPQNFNFPFSRSV